MATRTLVLIFLWVQKLQNSTSEIIQILQSYSPQYGDVQVIFKGFAEIQNGRHGSISISLNSKILVRNNGQVILLKFKMATTSRLFKYL